MSNKRVSSKRSERTKIAFFASPSLQPSSEAFAVPLPPDLEDEGLLMPENTTEGNPDYEQKASNKQYYGQQDKVRRILEESIDPFHSYSCVSLCVPK